MSESSDLTSTSKTTKGKIVKRRKLTLELFRVVAYDIPEDKTRTRLHKLMKGYLNPVQYSVFEGMLNHKHLAEAIDQMKQLINPDEDLVRVYSLCSKCAKNTQIWGATKLYIDEGFYII